MQISKQSFLINSKSLFNLFLATCQRAKKETKAKKRGKNLSLKSFNVNEKETISLIVFF